METCKRYLKYVFTEEEKKLMGSDLAQKFAIHTEAEGRLKSVSTQIKSEISTIESQMASISEKIRSGYEYRDIECDVEMDYDRGRVVVIRMDTGEIVEDRAMSVDERQKPLFKDN